MAENIERLDGSSGRLAVLIRLVDASMILDGYRLQRFIAAFLPSREKEAVVPESS